MTSLATAARLFMAATALLLIATPALAVEYTFGSAVGSADYDFSPLAESQRVALCYIEFNGDSVPNADEPVFLMTRVATNGVCPAGLTTPSILLNAVPGRPAGMEVSGVDPWSVKSVRTLTDLHAVRYVEEGSDASKFDAKDWAYLDLKNVGRSIVEPGDLRLSPVAPYKAGSIVAAGDSDVANPLVEIRGTLRQVHSTNMIYKAASGFYLNADAGALGGTVDGTCVTTACPVTGDFGVESGDLRLNPKAVNPLSDLPIVLPERVEILQPTVAVGQPFQVKVTAKNTGKIAGAGLIETRLDDVVMDGRGTPSIESNGIATMTITLFAPATPGLYTVKSGTYGDFLTVTALPVLTTPSAADVPVVAQAKGSPGLPVVAVLALVGLVAVLRRGR